MHNNNFNFDECCNIIDEMGITSKYIPTVEDLEAHNIKNNIIKYAPFLIYISESIKTNLSSLTSNEKKELQRTQAYITHAFSEAEIF